MDIHIAENRAALGEAAGKAIAAALRDRIAVNGSASVAFAAAPSQNETLATLIAEPGIDWGRVTAYHLDEYAGATPDAPYSFRRFLREHVFDHVKPAVFHQLRGEAKDRDKECDRYAALLPEEGFDIALLGIGENGHVAFNDPPCDFDDPADVKVVELDDACRLQQVNDGAFANLDDVPAEAFTLTIPVLLSAREMFIMVPGPKKAAAVAFALEGPVSSRCPASVLRTRARTTLYLDRDSASLLSA